MKRLLEKLLTFIGFGPSVCCASTSVENHYESEEYQEFVASMAKYCICDDTVCDSVLAGGPCEERIREDEEFDYEPDYSLDDLDWDQRYPNL